MLLRILVAVACAAVAQAHVGFYPSAGTYTNVVNLQLAATDLGSFVYFTTDGSAPSSTSTLFDTPVTLSNLGKTVVKAVAISYTGKSSRVMEAHYTIVAGATTIAFNPPNGTVFESFGDVIVTAVGGNSVAATIDGSLPVLSVASQFTWPPTASPYAQRVHLGQRGVFVVRDVATNLAGNTTQNVYAEAVYEVTAPAVFGAAIAPPVLCFADQSCIPLWNYVQPVNLSVTELNFFANNPNQQVFMPTYSSYGDGAGWNVAFPAYNETMLNLYGASWWAMTYYVDGMWMSNANALLRASTGLLMPVSYKAPALLTASAIALLGQNATTQAYLLPNITIYRGEPVFEGAPCPLVSPFVPGINLTGTTREIWAFDSWSRNLEMSRSWQGSTRVMMMHKRVLEGPGHYIFPFSQPGQYEVTVPPGTRVKSLACEQTSFSEVGDSGQIAVEYLYDITLLGELSPADEATLLAQMRAERMTANNTCWVNNCQCSGLSANAQAAWDPNVPVPNSVCTDDMSEHLAVDDDISGTRGSSGSVIGAVVIAPIMAGIVIAVVVVMRRRRQYSRLDGRTMVVEMRMA